MTSAFREQLGTLRTRALIGGSLLLVLVGLLAFIDAQAALQAYLIGWLMWWGVGMGAMGFILVHHLSGGRWGHHLGPLFQAAMRTVPITSLLFLPILLGVPKLYIWAMDPIPVDHHALHFIEAKGIYLTWWFFSLRSIAYLAISSAMAWFLAHGHPSKRQGSAGVLLMVFVMTVTFAAIDWGMSLDPAWFSAIYGVLVIVGMVVGCFTVTTIAYVLTRHDPAQPGGVRVGLPPMDRDILHDLGRWLLMSVCLWAYIQFSQYLIIYYGDLLEEIPWYLPRIAGGWKNVGIVLVLGHFLVPFALLLPHDNKRNGRFLLLIASGLLVFHFVDLLWLVVPRFVAEESLRSAYRSAWTVGWVDAMAALGLGGVWLSLYASQLRKIDLTPTDQPAAKSSHAHDATEVTHGTP